MHKDFKNAKPAESGYKTGMAWMLAGVFMGLLVGLSMYFYANRNTPSFAANIPDVPASELTHAQRVALANQQNTDAVINTKTNSGPAPLPDVLDEPTPQKRAIFSFHAVLPSIDMPVQPRTVALANTVKQVKARSAESGDYMLQVASFKSSAQADRSQQKLNKRGVAATVQKYSSKGKTWYRVLAGPVAPVQLEDWKSQVKVLGYDPLVRRIR
jgi:cell division protein FtsN